MAVKCQIVPIQAHMSWASGSEPLDWICFFIAFSLHLEFKCTKKLHYIRIYTNVDPRVEKNPGLKKTPVFFWKNSGFLCFFKDFVLFLRKTEKPYS